TRFSRDWSSDVCSSDLLDSLLQTIMADYVLILQDKGMEWHLDLPSKPVPAAFDHDGLSQAVRNLIDNAILHGGGGKYLGVRLIRSEERRVGNAWRSRWC